MDKNAIVINGTTTLIDALKKMDELDRKLLIVCDNDVFIGVLSIGDIQRAIINKTNLNEQVKNHLRHDIVFSSIHDDRENIKEQMKKERIECMPVVNDSSELVDIIEWDEAFSKEKFPLRAIDCPVVIMAGGKGERLKPLTNLIPKPLIPVSQKTIIEEIIDRFCEVSCSEFYLSINYKADVVREFFETMQNRAYSINYIVEEKPLGTAGSLWLLKTKIHRRFIVSNCDALIDVNLHDLIDFHIGNNNMATMVSVVKNVDIPYGVIETTNNGELQTLEEKPNRVLQVNCGLYVFEPEALSFINDNEFLNITDLLIRIKESGHKVGVFPIPEKSWKDMGNWTEYLKMINSMR